MRYSKNHWLSTMMFVASMTILLLSGCGNAGETANTGPAAGDGTANRPAGSAAPEIPVKPVTLKFFANVTEDTFQDMFADPLKEKFPTVTLELMTGNSAKLAEQVGSGTIPDLMYVPQGRLYEMLSLDLLSDLTPLIKQYKFDLGRLNPDVRNFMTSFFASDQLLFMPYINNVAALMYNKDIFDKFGVPYPKDGMTWSQVYQLAKQVTRTEGDIQYLGIDFFKGYLMRNNQMPLAVVDPKTEKAAVNSDGWKTWFQTMSSFYSIPGNQLDAKTFNVIDMFANRRNIAMFAPQPFPNAKLADLRWDIVSLPTFDGKPGVGLSLSLNTLAISKVSKNKDTAFQIIQYLLSDEMQTKNSMQGTAPVLASKDIEKVFGKQSEQFQNRHIEALFANRASPAQPVTPYDSAAIAILLNKFGDVILNQKDINSALREADDQINQSIQEAKAKESR